MIFDVFQPHELFFEGLVVTEIDKGWKLTSESFANIMFVTDPFEYVKKDLPKLINIFPWNADAHLVFAALACRSDYDIGSGDD
jgi:hypothetical protein